MSRYITGFLFGNFSANSPAHLVEKDDVLLYMTAFIGVVMPGCIYVLYHNIYQIYCRYAERKAKEASYELSLCTAITIFHASNGEIGKRLAIVLARKLEAAAPSVVDIANLNISYFSHYKGIGLFIIVTGQGGREPENVEWFFDWLEDIALSSSPKTQLECRNMHFAVLGINEAYEANRYNRAAITLGRRLESIGACQLCRPLLVDWSSNEELNIEIDMWGEQFMDTLNNFPRLDDRSQYDSSSSDYSEVPTSSEEEGD